MRIGDTFLHCTSLTTGMGPFPQEVVCEALTRPCGISASSMKPRLDTDQGMIFEHTIKPEWHINPFVLVVKALDNLGTGYAPARITYHNEKSQCEAANPVEDTYQALLELRDLYARTAETSGSEEARLRSDLHR